MSATSSDLIADALLGAAASSSVDRRLILADHLGIDLERLHDSLLAGATEMLDLRESFAVVLGKPAEALPNPTDYEFTVVRAGEILVLPFLVSAAHGRNKGSQGFAAALRS